MTITLQSVADQRSDQNFRQVALTLDNIEAAALKLAVPGASRVAVGQVPLTWSESTLSAAATITHGLGATPVFAAAFSLGAPEAGKIPLGNTFSYTNTTFALNAETKNPHSGNISMVWIALS